MRLVDRALNLKTSKCQTSGLWLHAVKEGVLHIAREAGEPPLRGWCNEAAPDVARDRGADQGRRLVVRSTSDPGSIPIDD